MKRVFVVRTGMKTVQELKFEWFEVYGVFSTLKKAKEAVYAAYGINKGENVSEYQNSGTLQINYDLKSTDGTPCEYRALINEHYINRNWIH